MAKQEGEKKPRITDKAGPLISSLNKMAANVAFGLAHHQKFSYADFLNLFVRASARECLLAASEVAYATHYPYTEVVLPNHCSARMTLQHGKFLMPRPDNDAIGVNHCTNLELRSRFLEWLNQKREFAVGFARARVLIKHLVGNYEPHVATYLLPSLQLLAKDTTVEKYFVRAGVGTVPALAPMWREACKRVAATITGAQLVQNHDSYPSDLEVLIGLVEYDLTDVYPNPVVTDEPLAAITLKVKDTY
jgi:hypothetical protein